MNGDARLLAVLAHPDDETFGMGGTLALYAHRGVEVYLACATRGEVGDVAPEMLQGYQTIGELREAELCCAAQKLGLKKVIFLGYRDSGMPGSASNHHPDALASAPPHKIAADVTHVIREIRPQVVLTFDPIGGYRHPDHIAIQEATVEAFHAAGNPLAFPDGLPPYQPQKLYFQTISRRFMRLGLFMLRLFGRDPRRFGNNGDIDLVSIADVSFPIDAVIDYTPVGQLRREAALCHASQGGPGMARGIQGWLMSLMRARETYMQAYPDVRPGRLIRDLFEGVEVANPQ